MQKGKLYLIPNSIGNNNLDVFIAPEAIKIIKRLEFFITENIKSAEKFLKLVKINKPLADLTLYLLNEQTKISELNSFLEQTIYGNDIGLISEAGLPCIADPGAEIVKLAHQKNIKVIPLAGASSVLLGLISSGLNGQAFTFNGYLPINKNARCKMLKELEKIIFKTNYTQIFIEAPHRNDILFKDILQTCSEQLYLTIAKEITSENEYIYTQKISQWKKSNLVLGKVPVIFLLGK